MSSDTNVWETGVDNNGNGNDNNQYYISDSVNRLTIQRGTGNIGVGTDAPSQLLDVSGNINLSGNIYLSNTGTIYKNGQEYAGGSEGTSTVWQENGTKIHYSTGNVGINTDNPSETLEVAGNIKATNIEAAGTNITAINATNITSGTLDNARLPADISITGDMTAKNLNVTGSTTTINTDTYQTENLEIISTGADGPSLKITHDTVSHDVMQVIDASGTQSLTMTHEGKIGIGTNAPSAPLHIYDTSSTSDIFKASDTEITINRSIIPETNDTVDIGSAERKIRDMYISNNSLWLGDDHKLAITSDGTMKFRKRDKSVLPKTLRDALGTEEEAINHVNQKYGTSFAYVSEFKLNHVLSYARTINSTYKTSDIFGDDAEDYEQDTAADAWQLNSSKIYLGSGYTNIGIGTNNPDPAFKLDVAGNLNTTGTISADDITIKGSEATGSGAIKLNCEANSHGVSIKGPPHSAAATYTLTLPNNVGSANQIISTDGSGNLSFIDQNTSGTTYSSITEFDVPVLPANDSVLSSTSTGLQWVKQTGGSSGVTNTTSNILTQKSIEPTATPSIISEYISESTNDYKILAFTYDSTNANASDQTEYLLNFSEEFNCDILMVGGGGSGSQAHGGGGGAGSVIFMKDVKMNGEYTFKIGNGGDIEGTPGSSTQGRGFKGKDSEIYKSDTNKVIAEGGGGGGENSDGKGGNGGSGGGGDGYNNATLPATGGTANSYTPILESVSGIKYGNDGGTITSNPWGGAGGGGAGGDGVAPSTNYGNNNVGGVGIEKATLNGTEYNFKTHFNINNTSIGHHTGGEVYFGGGGGGGVWSTTTGSAGGLGGGGGGGRGGDGNNTASGEEGTANTGGGGGGGGDNQPVGGKGGSGIILIRYKTLKVIDDITKWFEPKFYSSSNPPVLTSGPVTHYINDVSPISDLYRYSIFKYDSTNDNGSNQTDYQITFSEDTEADVLIVAGGGGGSGGHGGGGGAGQLVFIHKATLNGTYNIKVGKGGTKGTNPPSGGIEPTKGADSIFDSVTAEGGGANGGSALKDGGSGAGGDSWLNGLGTKSKGLKNTNVDTYSSGNVYSKGNDGGEGSDGNGQGAGGGGAGTAGEDGALGNTNASPGNGGSGISGISEINFDFKLNFGSAVGKLESDNLVYFAGGGGGGGWDISSGETNSVGGKGGGGAGGIGSGTSHGGDGYENTGSGGGGGSANYGEGGNGGSGAVIIRYLAKTLTQDIDTTLATKAGENIEWDTDNNKFTLTSNVAITSNLDVYNDINFMGNLYQNGELFVSGGGEVTSVTSNILVHKILEPVNVPNVESEFVTGSTEYKILAFQYDANNDNGSEQSSYNLTFDEETLCDILIVGGGGGGGGGSVSGNDGAGGGGGAGGLVFFPNFTANGSYTIKVGNGGLGQTDAGLNGANSTIEKYDGTGTDGIENFIATGGGGGGDGATTDQYSGPGNAGGSGGGGGGNDATSGGISTQNTYSGKGFGNAGGNSSTSSGDQGGGGGGAGGAGQTSQSSSTADHGGEGGIGLHKVTIDGTEYKFKNIFGTSYGEYVVSGATTRDVGSAQDYFNLYYKSGTSTAESPIPPVEEGVYFAGGGAGKTGNNTNTNYLTYGGLGGGASVDCKTGVFGSGINGTGGGGTSGGKNEENESVGQDSGTNGGSGIVIIRYKIKKIFDDVTSLFQPQFYTSISEPSVANYGDVTTNLIAHYKFDLSSNLGANSASLTGSNLNGTTSGNATINTTKGIFNNSSYYPGNAQSGIKIDANSNKLYPYLNQSAITISFWCWTIGTGGNAHGRLFYGHVNGSANNVNSFQCTHWSGAEDGQSDAAQLTFIISNNGEESSGNYMYTTKMPALNTAWSHVVLVIEPQSTNWTTKEHNVKIYVNGELDQTYTNMYMPTFGNGTTDTYDFNIGSWINLDTNYREYNGYLDDFRIYNKTLSAAEVEKLYTNAYVDKKSVTNSDIYNYYSFKNKNKDIVYDFTPYNNLTDWQNYANSIGSTNVTNYIDTFNTNREGGAFVSGSGVGYFTLNSIPSGFNYITVKYGNSENNSPVKILIDSGSGFVEVDSVGGNEYKIYTTKVSTGDILKIEEHNASLIGEDLIIILHSYAEYVFSFSENNTCKLLLTDDVNYNDLNNVEETLNGNYIVKVGTMESSIEQSGTNFIYKSISGSAYKLVYDFSLHTNLAALQNYATTIPNATLYADGYSNNGFYIGNAGIGYFSMIMPSGYDNIKVEYSNTYTLGTVNVYIGPTDNLVKVSSVGGSSSNGTYNKNTYEGIYTAGETVKITEEGTCIIGNDLKITFIKNNYNSITGISTNYNTNNVIVKYKAKTLTQDIDTTLATKAGENIEWDTDNKQFTLSSNVAITSNLTVYNDINFMGNLYQNGELFVSGGGEVTSVTSNILVHKIIEPTNVTNVSSESIPNEGDYRLLAFQYDASNDNGSKQTEYTLNIQDSTILDILIVGAGGSGGCGSGTGTGGGGGGGGEVKLIESFQATSNTSYTIIVGKGGEGKLNQSYINGTGNIGNNSSFDIHTALGGGGGGIRDIAASSSSTYTGGGEGGYGGGGNTGASGYDGGKNNNGNGKSTNNGAGGGGGSGGVGQDGLGENGGDGGIGLDRIGDFIFAENFGTTYGYLEGGTTWFGGGGGGSGSEDNGTNGDGKHGGTNANNTNGISENALWGGGSGGAIGTADTDIDGDGSYDIRSGDGGSGIVIIRYKIKKIFDDVTSLFQPQFYIMKEKPQITSGPVAQVTDSYVNGSELYKYMMFTYDATNDNGSGQTEYTLNFTEDTNVDILVVAGGGAGGTYIGGGGGGGGVLHIKNTTINTGSYSIKVGKGGDSVVGSAAGAAAQQGKKSEAFGIEVFGGGYGGGGSWGSSTNGQDGSTGGSGGAGGSASNTAGLGGTKLLPNMSGALIPTTSYEYYGGNGADSMLFSSSNAGGAIGANGGGGAGGNAPANIDQGNAGAGADGIPINITGTTHYWGGGGGGGQYEGTKAGNGGKGGGGGGNGSQQSEGVGIGGSGGITSGQDGDPEGDGSPTAGSGGAHTGGGGGGTGRTTGSPNPVSGAGGSGVVIIRYLAKSLGQDIDTTLATKAGENIEWDTDNKQFTLSSNVAITSNLTVYNDINFMGNLYQNGEEFVSGNGGEPIKLSVENIIATTLSPTAPTFDISSDSDYKTIYFKYDSGNVNTLGQTEYTLAFSSSTECDILLVGGGGGGGSDNSGGGGAGGLVLLENIQLYNGITIKVGGGGAGAASGQSNTGQLGKDSSIEFSETYIAKGGGGGGTGQSNATLNSGTSGGSGGGSAYEAHDGSPGTSAQDQYIFNGARRGWGFAGGDGKVTATTGQGAGGGGGGASEVGINANIAGNKLGGHGGDGKYEVNGADFKTIFNITDTTIGDHIDNKVYFAGGGGGGNDNDTNSISLSDGSGYNNRGGFGGGGGGGYNSTYDSNPAISNTGGGGGGTTYYGSNYKGGNGGSGIVILRYKYRKSLNIPSHYYVANSGPQITSGPVAQVTDSYVNGSELYKYMMFTYDATNDNGSGQTEYTLNFTEDTNADILVVAGGGAGGIDSGGGGGGGGVAYTTTQIKLFGEYTIKVGKGGIFTANVAEFAEDQSSDGKNSSITNETDTIEVVGGGSGAYLHSNADDGNNGGSSGGGDFNNTEPPGAVIAATKTGIFANINTTGGQGNTGGNGYAGGGGGAGGATSSSTADGNDGIQNNIDGNNYYWAGGGAGGFNNNYTTGTAYGGKGGGGGGGNWGNATMNTNNTNTGGVGGINAGGDGTYNGNAKGGDGGQHTGSGGAGGGNTAGGNGGSGVVIIRYLAKSLGQDIDETLKTKAGENIEWDNTAKKYNLAADVTIANNLVVAGNIEQQYGQGTTESYLFLQTSAVFQNDDIDLYENRKTSITLQGWSPDSQWQYFGGANKIAEQLQNCFTYFLAGNRRDGNIHIITLNNSQTNATADRKYYAMRISSTQMKVWGSYNTTYPLAYSSALTWVFSSGATIYKTF